jgi:hypothetical protein
MCLRVAAALTQLRQLSDAGGTAVCVCVCVCVCVWQRADNRRCQWVDRSWRNSCDCRKTTSLLSCTPLQRPRRQGTQTQMLPRPLNITCQFHVRTVQARPHKVKSCAVMCRLRGAEVSWWVPRSQPTAVHTGGSRAVVAARAPLPQGAAASNTRSGGREHATDRGGGGGAWSSLSPSGLN